MSDALEKKIIDWVENSTAFLAEEIPEFGREIVNYGIVFNYILLLVCLSLLIFILVTLARFFKQHKDDESNRSIPTSMSMYKEEYTPAEGFFSVIAMLTCLVLFLISIGCVNGISKAYFAPKLYVIEKLRG